VKLLGLDNFLSLQEAFLCTFYRWSEMMKPQSKDSKSQLQLLVEKKPEAAAVITQYYHDDCTPVLYSVLNNRKYWTIVSQEKILLMHQTTKYSTVWIMFLTVNVIT
jgi:hypothetical protein